MAVNEVSGIMKYKDAAGNTYLMMPVTKKENVDGMEDIDAHLTNENNPHKVTAEQVGAAAEEHTHYFDVGIITGGTGAAYTVTVPGITELVIGHSITIIPHTSSTTKTATLNVNGLGAKAIRQRLSTNTSTTVASHLDNWLVANKPVRVTYNGTHWVSELTRPDVNTLYGTVLIQNGGTYTNEDTTEQHKSIARANLGVPSIDDVKQLRRVVTSDELSSAMMGDGVYNIEPNVLYIFPNLDDLSEGLGIGYSADVEIDETEVQEYKFRFTCGTSVPQISLPSNIIGDLDVQTGRTYEVSIVDGYLVSRSWVTEETI